MRRKLIAVALVASSISASLCGLARGDDANEKAWKVGKSLEGHKGAVSRLEFSPDGKLLASASEDKTIILWDAATGKLVSKLEGHVAAVDAIAFAPDGKSLASGAAKTDGAADKSVRLWDVATGKLTAKLEGHKGWVTAVAFSPDGKTLASGSSDDTVKLWDVAGRKVRSTLEGHTFVESVAFSPDGKKLAVADFESTVRLWDVATAKLIRKLSDARTPTFAPDGKTLACDYNGQILIVEVSSGEVTRRLDSPWNPVEKIAFASGGAVIVSCGYMTTWLSDAQTGKVREKITSEKVVSSFSLSPDGKTLALTSEKSVQLWRHP